MALDPYTLFPAQLDPTDSAAVTKTVYTPSRRTSITARMLRRLKASPLRLYSWGRGNLPHRLLDTVAAEVEHLSVTVHSAIYRAITESTYRAWHDPLLFPARGRATLARGAVRLSVPTPLGQAYVIPAGSLFGAPDGRMVKSESEVTFAPGASSVVVPVVSDVIGAAGNMPPGTVTRMLSGYLSFSVTNPVAITGGRDQEGEGEMRVRFQDFVESRATASRLSVFSAVVNTQITSPAHPQAQEYPQDAALILPWLIPGWNDQMAHGYVVVDTGGATASGLFLEAANNKLQRLQAAGDHFVAISASPWMVPLNLKVSTTPLANPAQITAALNAAWSNLTAWCPIEDGRGRGRLSVFGLQVALEAAHPEIVQVRVLAPIADLQPPVGARLVAGEVQAEIIAGGVI